MAEGGPQAMVQHERRGGEWREALGGEHPVRAWTLHWDRHTTTTTSSSADPTPNSPSFSANELFFLDSLISVAGNSILMMLAFDYMGITVASSLPFQHSV